MGNYRPVDGDGNTLRTGDYICTCPIQKTISYPEKGIKITTIKSNKIIVCPNGDVYLESSGKRLPVSRYFGRYKYYSLIRE